MKEFDNMPGAIYAVKTGDTWSFVVANCPCESRTHNSLAKAESCTTRTIRQLPARDTPSN